MTKTTRKPLQKYNPGSLDEADLESLKMSVSEELWDISTNFVQTDEILGDVFEKTVTLEIDRDNMNVKIEDYYNLSVENDKALAERINKVEAEIGEDIRGAIAEEARVRADADGVLAEKITTVKAESEAGIAEVKQTTTAISNSVGQIEAKWGVEVDVNGKISGIQMNNNGERSNFEVRADSFKFTDTSGNTSGGFESSGGITKFSGELQAAKGTFSGDLVAAKGTFSGELVAASGSFKGRVEADSGVFNGTVNASSGTFTGTVNAIGGDFRNVTIREDCTVLGTLYADRIVGLPTGKSFGVSETRNLANETVSVYSTPIVSGEGRMHIRCMLGGLPQVYSTGGSCTAVVEVWMHGKKVFESPIQGAQPSWTDIPQVVGRPIDVGASGGALEIRVRVSGNGSLKFRMHEGFIYQAIDR